MRKQKKPITTGGWLRLQANNIIERIDEILDENKIDSENFSLHLSANVVRTICNISIFSNLGQVFHGDAPLFEDYNPFDDKSYWEKTAQLISKKYGFTKVTKVPNVRQYEFRR